MAKRYHQDDRSRQEKSPCMINEDHNAVANLPQEVMIKYYPKNGPYMPEEIDDTMHGIDEQIGSDDSQRRKHFKPHKY